MNTKCTTKARVTMLAIISLAITAQAQDNPKYDLYHQPDTITTNDGWRLTTSWGAREHYNLIYGRTEAHRITVEPELASTNGTITTSIFNATNSIWMNVTNDQSWWILITIELRVKTNWTHTVVDGKQLGYVSTNHVAEVPYTFAGETTTNEVIMLTTYGNQAVWRDE